MFIGIIWFLCIASWFGTFFYEKRKHEEQMRRTKKHMDAILLMMTQNYPKRIDGNDILKDLLEK